MNAVIAIALTLAGIAGTQYALGMLLRMKNVYIPLTKEMAQKAELPKKLYSSLKVDTIMSIIMLFLIPFLVYIYGGQLWHVVAYLMGAVVSALMLRGKCNRDDSTLRLYFYRYRVFLQNILILRDDPAYNPYMTYRRRSLIERALDAEEQKKQQEQKEKAENS
jgi:hypothetical protein